MFLSGSEGMEIGRKGGGRWRWWKKEKGKKKGEVGGIPDGRGCMEK